MTRPLYVVCVFNLYAGLPSYEGETPEQRDERQRTYHCVGFTADEAAGVAENRFGKSCDHHWYPPTPLGEFPTRRDDGREVADVASLTCPHCGQTF